MDLKEIFNRYGIEVQIMPFEIKNELSVEDGIIIVRFPLYQIPIETMHHIHNAIKDILPPDTKVLSLPNEISIDKYSKEQIKGMIKTLKRIVEEGF